MANIFNTTLECLQICLHFFILPLSYHHSHFWAATLDSKTFSCCHFFTWAAPFLQLGCFCVDLILPWTLTSSNQFVYQFISFLISLSVCLPFSFYSLKVRLSAHLVHLSKALEYRDHAGMILEPGTVRQVNLSKARGYRDHPWTGDSLTGEFDQSPWVQGSY